MNSRRSRGFKNVKKQGFKVIRLHEHELEKVLKYDLQLDKVKSHTGRKGKNFQFCCPFHGENRPSAGILMDSDGSMYGQCYTCEETFTLPKLYAFVKDISIMEAIDELEEEYRSEIRTEIFGIDKVKSYDESRKEKVYTRTELPTIKLAPYRSGKETHNYFFDRGFNDRDVKENKIGWDSKKKRITIPIFHSDGTLSGFSGRAVLEQKLPSGKLSKKYMEHYGEEPKYFIYNNFPIGEVLYGSHDFPEGEKTAILVEGLFDRIWMKKMGYSNALSTIIAKMSRNSDGSSHQKEILQKLGVKNVIFMHDNDEAGRVGKQIAYEILKDDFTCYDTKYPDGWDDVMGDSKHPPMTKKQLEKMLSGKTVYGKKKVRRYE